MLRHTFKRKIKAFLSSLPQSCIKCIYALVSIYSEMVLFCTEELKVEDYTKKEAFMTSF